MDVPDHRRLGRQLEIFSTEEECGAGLPLWLPAGAIIRDELVRYVSALEREHGYQHVSTPVMAKQELYERSGHWAHYQQDMYPAIAIGAEQLVLRPMLCPHHILIYDRRPRSPRELPMRIAEVGSMFRNERSGVVGGLSRVRQMTLNDGHIFCTEEHVADEIADILAMVHDAYAALHIPAPKARLSRGGEGPKFVDDASVWQRGESLLRDALEREAIDYAEATGQAAFYGPKIDLQVTDPRGREETLSTIQIDLVLPQRFGLSIDGDPAGVLMIHRSIIGTIERMTAHLLEVHNGALPPWLSPVQVIVLPATDDDASRYADTVNQQLLAHGLRSELNQRDATLGARIRRAQQRKIPYLAVVGPREQRDGTIAIRLRTGQQLDSMPVAEFITLVKAAIDDHSIELVKP